MVHEFLPEHSLISLATDFETSIGLIPAGSIGTVIYAYDGGYDVEFLKPVRCIVYLQSDKIND